MATESLVIVYRSEDMNAEQSATVVKNFLIKRGLDAHLVEGAVEGNWDVSVPQSQAAQAESLIPEINEDEFGEVDPSAELDFVTIAETQGITGEMEALGMQSILDANGITALLQGSSVLPNLSFAVVVSKSDRDRALAVLEEARAAGPAAAVEAERESEGPA